MHKLPINCNYKDVYILNALSKANNKLSELNELACNLQHQDIILNAIALCEAKESSEIENIVTTFDEIFKEITLKTNNVNSKEIVGYRQAVLSGY